MFHKQNTQNLQLTYNEENTKKWNKCERAHCVFPYKETKSPKTESVYLACELGRYPDVLQSELSKFGQCLTQLITMSRRVEEISQNWMENQYARRNRLNKKKIPSDDWKQLGEQLHKSVKKYCKRHVNDAWWKWLPMTIRMLFQKYPEANGQKIEIPLQWLPAKDSFCVPVSFVNVQRYISTAKAVVGKAYHSKWSLHTWWSVLTLYNLSSASTTVLSGILKFLNFYVNKLERELDIEARKRLGKPDSSLG